MISRVDQGTSAIVRYLALLGKTLALLQTGRLGDVLRIARGERALAEKNGSAPWMFDFREAWVRTLVFDFEGARKICEMIGDPKAQFLLPQLRTMERIAAGSMELERREYAQALEHFREVRDPEVTPKFLLHWIFRMTAQLESGNGELLAGNILRARAEADEFLAGALRTANPHVQALAWELKTRVAMAEGDFGAAREHARQGLAIVEESEVLVAGWQMHATAWELFRRTKEEEMAELHLERARECIRVIADSFEVDEPLRASFLSAAAVARVLGGAGNERASASV